VIVAQLLLAGLGSRRTQFVVADLDQLWSGPASVRYWLWRVEIDLSIRELDLIALLVSCVAVDQMVF